MSHPGSQEREPSIPDDTSGETVRRSGEWQRFVLEHIPGVVYLCHQDERWTLLHLSGSVQEMTGYRREEFLSGRVSFADLYHPDDRLGIGTQVESALAQNAPFRLLFRIRHKDGGWRWVEEAGKGVRGPDGACLVAGHLDDRTTTMRAEALLRESEERHRSLFMAMQEGFALHEIICDAAGRPCDYRYLDVNPGFERATGIPRERWVGRTVREVLPNVEDYWIQGYGAVALTGQAATFENYVRELDRYYEVVAYSPKLGQFAAIALDVTDRKRSEHALRASEERLRETARIARVGGWEIDLTSHALSWTDETFRLHELDPDYSPTVSDAIQFYHPEDRPLVAAAVQKAVDSGAVFDFEARLITARQNVLWVRAIGSPICRDGRLAGIRGMVQDITDRKRAEEALKSQEGRYRTIVEHVNDAFYIHDFRGRIADLNENACRLTLFSREELIAGGLSLIDSPGEAAAMPGRMAALLAEGSLQFEGVHRRKDGVLVPVSVSARVVSREGDGLVQSFVRDMTERNRAEEALRRSEALYHDLVETSQDLIWQCDAQGRYTYLNPVWEQVFGYRLDEMLGRPFTDFQTPGQARDDRELFGRLLTEGSIKGYETTHLRKDGTAIHLVFNAKTLHGADGQVAGTRGTAYNITERRQSEAERERLQRQLTQSQKMESIGRLAGGVAHDFNNMLQAILGNTALAFEELPTESMAREYLQEIQKCAQRSADLTRQLLAFARKQTIAPTSLDLNDTVAGMLKMLRRLMGEGIDLAWLPGAGLGLVHMDPSQVDQILANLCVNARDAISGGVGAVTIETSNARIDDAHAAGHPESRTGEYVRLAVCDNGCGMSPEVQTHLFEPFFTTKPVGQGTGLGLATVYGIVKQNDGFISVRSEQGQGTTVEIHLPRHTAGANRHEGAASASAPGGGVETILLVEDEPAILRVSQRMLEKLGYRVAAARTPGEAIRLAREHAGEIQLLVTDVVMPEMNGRDLARNLLHANPHLRRLFMSGYTADVIAHHGVLDPGVHFIQKPFSVQALADKVREALDG